MISANEKLLSKQKHADMLDGANQSVELDFICCIIALGAKEGTRDDFHWML